MFVKFKGTRINIRNVAYYAVSDKTLIIASNSKGVKIEFYYDNNEEALKDLKQLDDILERGLHFISPIKP